MLIGFVQQKKAGVIPKDTSKGPFVDEWKKIFADNCKDVEEVDVALALSSACFAAKDEAELRAMRTSSKACVALTHSFLLDDILNTFDQEKKVKHRVLTDKVDSKLDDNKFWKNIKLPSGQKFPSDFDPQQLDWIVGPSVYSGGKFDLKMQAEPSEENLHPGVIIAGMALKYKSYSSHIARTYMVDPNKTQENNYKFLLALHGVVLKEIRDGAVAKDVYNKAVSYIKSKKPEFEKHFLKNVGYGTGLEVRDPTLVLNAKNTRTLKDGMTLCISTGFADLENPQPQDKNSKVYSLIVTDTIRVTNTSEGTISFTGEAPTDPDSTTFFFKDEEESQPAPKKEKKDSKVGAVAAKNITSSRLRSGRGQQEKSEEDQQRRRAHQKQLAEKKQKEGLARYAESTGGQNGSEVKKFKRFESYKRDNQLPPKVRDMGIVLDTKNSTIIVPVMGRPVPYHINTIKNASKNDEGEWSYLRINFLSPGQGVGRKDDQPFEDASAHFVRSLTFRSTDGDRYAEIANQITNIKRDSAKKEQEKKDMEDVVEQDKLVEIRSKLSRHHDRQALRLTSISRPSPGCFGQRLSTTGHGR